MKLKKGYVERTTTRLTDRAVGEGAGPREHAEDRERQGRAAGGGGVL